MIDPITGVGGGSAILALALAGFFGWAAQQEAARYVYGKRIKKFTRKLEQAELRGDEVKAAKYAYKILRTTEKWDKIR